MSWICPHQTSDEHCNLRKKECKPGSDGCVLAKKFNFVNIDETSDTQKEDNTSNNADDTTSSSL